MFATERVQALGWLPCSKTSCLKCGWNKWVSPLLWELSAPCTVSYNVVFLLLENIGK